MTGKDPLIVVVGPGAIGCLFAAMLVRAGRRVWLLGRNPAQAASINADGLVVDDDAGGSAVRAMATANARDTGKADFVLVCVKAYDTASARESLLPCLGERTAVASLQNGAGNLETLAERVPADRLVACVTAHGATLLGAGHVRHAGRGATQVASFSRGGRQTAGEVARLFAESGIETKESADYRRMLWSKLVVNAAINPVTALAGVPNGILLERPGLRARMRAAAQEAARVARAAGVTLNFDDEVAEAERVCKATAENRSSMLQDVTSRRKTEVDSITGYVVREARRLGIPVPVNEQLLAEVQAC